MRDFIFLAIHQCLPLEAFFALDDRIFFPANKNQVLKMCYGVMVPRAQEEALMPSGLTPYINRPVSAPVRCLQTRSTAHALALGVEKMRRPMLKGQPMRDLRSSLSSDIDPRAVVWFDRGWCGWRTRARCSCGPISSRYWL